MSSPLLPKPNTLKEAYQVCDLGALEGEEQKYYVDLSQIRDPTAINTIKTQLNFSDAGEFSTVLFTGHRGSGKSTELLRLKADLDQDYRVVYSKANDVLDINDVNYIDLYLVLVQEIIKELAKLKLKLNATLVENFENWFQEVTQETETVIGKSVGLETEVGVEVPLLMRLIAKVSAQIRGSQEQRTIVRARLQQNIKALQDNMNALLRDAFEKLKNHYPKYSKGFLVIFDNLDRMPPDVADRLYFDYTAQLTGIDCSLIYTVPISVVYSSRGIVPMFRGIHIVPMIKIYDRKHKNKPVYDEKAIQYFAQMITKRIDHKSVFASPSLVIRLLKESGGNVRQLMRMVSQACLVASSQGKDKIDQEVIQYVIKQEQFNFERSIPEHHYPLLAKVYQEQTVRQNEDGQIMLFNLSVLEYNGDRRWNYINPVIRGIEQFQEALQQIKTDNSNTLN